ncbi:DUF1686 domain-containing protein [Encephalitozoon cuniculi]|nr:DUF1686 domain-containing protein [Encephalitozoon cuniculi]
MESVYGSMFYGTSGDRELSTFLRHLNDVLGLHVFGKYFGYAVDDASLGCLGEVERELNALEKEISRYMLPNAQGVRVQGALRDVRESIGSLMQKLQALRAAYDQAVVDIEKNGASFAPKFNELDQMLGEASSGLDDLMQKIDELEKALPPPLRLHGRLGLVFAAILVVQCILWYLEEEDSATRRAWNTGVYSLAVAGTIVYQVWRLATRYRDDGVIGMLREEWTAVGCIVPMAAGLLHGGVVRSSVYSMTVAGIGAVMMAVQGGVLCGMSLMQVCVVVCGNLVLGALCVGGDGEWSLYLCVAAVAFASALLLVLNVGGGGEKSVGEGVESMVFVMSMLVCVCVCRMCVDGTTTWRMGEVEQQSTFGLDEVYIVDEWNKDGMIIFELSFLSLRCGEPISVYVNDVDGIVSLRSAPRDKGSASSILGGMRIAIGKMSGMGNPQREMSWVDRGLLIQHQPVAVSKGDTLSMPQRKKR